LALSFCLLKLPTVYIALQSAVHLEGSLVGEGLLGNDFEISNVAGECPSLV